ncbi:MAG: hypothetical protein R3264_17385, partial [Anaerolineae bacterium]|nr:hypothetical protein [Anaerolineae bacterium]
LLFLLPAGWLLFVPSPPIRKFPAEDQANGINYYVFLPLMLLFLIYVGAEASFNGWIFTYTITLFPGEMTIAGYLTSAYWGSLAVGRLLAIPISSRVGSWVMLLSSYLGCLLAIGLILIRPGSLIAVMVGTIGFGLSMASIFPTLLVFAERRMKVSGMVNGWLFGGAAVGGMIVPWFVGQLFEMVGPQSVMITIGTILSIAFVILLIRR